MHNVRGGLIVTNPLTATVFTREITALFCQIDYNPRLVPDNSSRTLTQSHKFLLLECSLAHKEGSFYFAEVTLKCMRWNDSNAISSSSVQYRLRILKYVNQSDSVLS